MKQFRLFMLVAMTYMVMGYHAKATTVASIISANDSLETLEAAVVAAGLLETLEGEGPFTVFAPTDDAFAALPEGTLEALLEDPSGELTNILLYHVVSGKAMSSGLSDGQVIETLLEKDITVTITEEGVFINGAQVTSADIEAENGVVHVINAVLLPDMRPATVVDIALSSDDFSILVAALTREDLTTDFVGALSGEGPFTVFAPTNAAFASLLEELGVSSLDDIDAATLEAVLQMHVVAGKVMSTDLNEGLAAETLLGQEITFSLEDGATVSDPNGRESNITAVDIEAQNGVVHVIDKVILSDLTTTSAPLTAGIQAEFYPNPAKGFITVTTNYAEGIIMISDISGRNILSERLTQSTQRIDLSNVKPGIYFISFHNNNSRNTQKLIVK